MLLVSLDVSAPHAAEPVNTVWCFAEKYKYGDLEPSEFFYVCIHESHEGVLLMHWKRRENEDTIDVYAVSGKDGNGFMERKKLTYAPGKRKRYVTRMPRKSPAGTGSSITLSPKRNWPYCWTTLKKEEADIHNAFPDAILENHFNYKPAY